MMKQATNRIKAEEQFQKSRRTEDPAVRKHQLIEATIDCIAKHGISGTTLSKVTEAAGLSLGLVNFHFASKDRLLEETIRFLALELRDAWKKPSKASKMTDAEQLQAIVDTVFHPKIATRRKLAVWFAFFGEASNRKIYLRLIEDLDDERYLETIRLFTELSKDNPNFHQDPEQLTLMLEALYDGVWLNMVLYPEDFTRDASKKQVYMFLYTLFPNHFAHLIVPSSRTGRS